MKVKSTGLGKTQLQCHFDGFAKKENGEPSVVMVITSTEPVHWHIEADLGGKDLRQMAGQMLKPATVWHLLKLLVLGSEAKGFVMEKDGGRRSTRDRVQREPVVARPLGHCPERSGGSGPVATAPAAAAVQEPVSAAVTATPAPSNGNLAAPSGGTAQRAAKADSSDLSEREQRRAELRKQREETAKQYAAV